ncbi:MAG: chemotaxis protein CheV [Francisellaceae bacterium]|jgi:two-component system, chemotaxis family, chemotaxis protein CheV|nr:chemotaxis protein CheV [Francisellaceae bacterium]
MSGVLENVDQRTQLAGQNRLELLIFQLGDEQLYGINVFKVKEIINTIGINKMPQSHEIVIGVSNIRGVTVPIYDLHKGIGRKYLARDSKTFIILTEINQLQQGLLVSKVHKIINVSWNDMHPPPPGVGNDCYLTSITKYNDQLIEIIDVEKVLQEVSPRFGQVSEENKQEAAFLTQEAVKKTKDKKVKILICDDSRVARNQLQKTLEQLGIKCVARENGQQALDLLKRWADKGSQVSDEFLMLITDIEMPEMDGYKLTTEIRKDPNLKGLYVVLHSSLSGDFNHALVDKVGANNFIPKFSPDKIAAEVNKRMG